MEYVTKGKQQIISDTRTSVALDRAGVPRSKWNAVDKTDDPDTMARVDKAVKKNELPDSGSPTVVERKKDEK